MSRKDYNIVMDARTSRHGLMKCSACGNDIKDGPYRYRDAGDRYITQHKACSLSDPQWAEMETRQSWIAASNKALLDAAKSFRDEWKIEELDELIESLERIA